MKKKIGILFCIMITALAFSLSPVTAGSAQAKVKLNHSSKTIAVGSTLQLKVKGTKKTIVWKSSDKKIAVVSNKGKVKAKKVGKCIITAKAGRKKLKCKVTVESKAAHQARILRSKILKKKNKRISAVTDDGDQKETVIISANSKNNKLKFEYSFSTVNTMDSFSLSMDFDLIKGKSGNYSYSRVDGGNDNYTWAYEGTINRKFKQSGGGLSVMKAEATEEGEYGDMVDVPNPKKDAPLMCSYMGGAFREFDALLSKKKTGTSMKKLGFTQWKK